MSAHCGFRSGFFVALFTSLALSCGGSDKSVVPPPDPFVLREIPAEVREDLGRLAAGNTEFALSLFGRLREQEGNLFLSPYSISTALAMVWAGARGESETEIAEALAFPFGQERLHVVFGSLQDNVQIGAGIGGYRLAIANRLWGTVGHTWRPEFLAQLSDNYRAPLEELDFPAHPEESRRVINLWVKERTDGTIPELLPSGSIGSATSLVLTNAIYFKGRWKYEFDPACTAVARFGVTDTDSMDVQMMFRKADYRVASFANHGVLDLPFQGMDLSLVVLLPTRWSLSRLEEELTPTNLESWLGGLQERETNVSMPKFSFSSKFRLRDDLSSLGMASAFEPGRADFSGMDGTRFFSLQEVYHEAFIRIDEVGAEAAAGTGGVPPPGLPLSFRVDRAFLFLIYDHVTRSVIFLGRVTRPVG